jgi:hypothetical protein
VATPLSWPEAGRAGLEPGQFTIATVRARLAGAEDPWPASPARLPLDGSPNLGFTEWTRDGQGLGGVREMPS